MTLKQEFDDFLAGLTNEELGINEAGELLRKDLGLTNMFELPLGKIDISKSRISLSKSYADAVNFLSGSVKS